MSHTIDLSEIRPNIINPNQVLQLIFPEKGLVHLRILNTDEVAYLYGSLSTIEPNSTDESTAQRLGIATYDIENALEVNKDLHMYQVFMGISPGIIRARIGYPVETLGRGLDVRGNQIAGDFGYIDGFRSSISKPSLMSEIIIPPDFDIGFVFHNPDSVPIKPLIYWHITTMRIQVIRNAELVYNIMAGKMRDGYVSKKNMGGIIPYRYHTRDMWGVEFIDHDVMDMVDIAESTGNKAMREAALNSIRTALKQEGRPATEVPPIY